MVPARSSGRPKSPAPVPKSAPAPAPGVSTDEIPAAPTQKAPTSEVPAAPLPEIRFQLPLLRRLHPRSQLPPLPPVAPAEKTTSKISAGSTEEPLRLRPHPRFPRQQAASSWPLRRPWRAMWRLLGSRLRRRVRKRTRG